MENHNVETVHVAGVELAKRTLHTPHTQAFVVEHAEAVMGADDDLRVVAEAVKRNMPVLFIGDTGTGKTSLVRQLAHVTAQPFRRLNLNGSTTVDEFAGRWTIAEGGRLQWLDGVLVEAMRHGHWLLLDEINAALPEVLFYLHALLDDDNMVVLAEKDGEVVKPHAEFRLFATMNPNRDYSGTRELNRALLSRFPVIVRSSYPSAVVESKVLTSRSAHVTPEQSATLVKIAESLRSAYKKGEVSYLCSTRDLLHVASLAAFMPFADAIVSGIVNRLDDESEQTLVRDVVKLHVGKLEEKAVLSFEDMEEASKKAAEYKAQSETYKAALVAALVEVGVIDNATSWNESMLSPQNYDATKWTEAVKENHARHYTKKRTAKKASAASVTDNA